MTWHWRQNLAFGFLSCLGQAKEGVRREMVTLGSKVSQGAAEMKRLVFPSGRLRVNLLVNFLAARLLEALI